jgi:hypothetical protein
MDARIYTFSQACGQLLPPFPLHKGAQGNTEFLRVQRRVKHYH